MTVPRHCELVAFVGTCPRLPSDLRARARSSSCGHTFAPKQYTCTQRAQARPGSSSRAHIYSHCAWPGGSSSPWS